MHFSTICICGAGTMGAGIAQVMAGAGFDTLLYEVQESVLTAARNRLETEVQKSVERGKRTADEGSALLRRIRYTTALNDCRADLVVEAIIEQEEAKLNLFRSLAGVNGPETVLASNTSSLRLSRLAAALTHPERVAGLHFFNPAPVMKLVEVVRTEWTLPAITDALQALVRTLGKTPVLCTDAPGFIVNRVARPYYIESLRMAEWGIDLSLIDRLLEARGFKMGPFRLMDLIGNDVNYAVSCSVYEQLGQPSRLRPSRLQEEKVKGGALGRKTGSGFYPYPE